MSGCGKPGCGCNQCPDTPEYQCCKGATGDTGPVGPQGPVGETGPSGQDGQHGLQGPTGPRGPEGCQGDRGATGQTGSVGPKGDQGQRGEKGCEGPEGPKGATGDRGPEGNAGPTGLQGDPGPKGDTGDTGATGAQGDKGDTGDTGPVGPRGLQGIQGAPGQNGLSAFVSKTEPDAAGCIKVTFRDAQGNPVECDFQGCVTNDACGCTGTCTTEAPSSVVLIEETESLVRYALTYPSGYTGEYQINRLSGSVFSVPVADPNGIHVTTDGETRNNFLIDTSGGPSAGGCFAPVNGKLDITNLTGGENGTRVKKVIGGSTEASTGFTDVGQNVFQLDGTADPAYDDEIAKVVVNGLGSTFLNEIQVLDGSTQTAHIWLELCFFTPVVYQTNALGAPVPGSAIDPNGAAVPDSAVNDLTGNPVF